MVSYAGCSVPPRTWGELCNVLADYGHLDNLISLYGLVTRELGELPPSTMPPHELLPSPLDTALKAIDIRALKSLSCLHPERAGAP